MCSATWRASGGRAEPTWCWKATSHGLAQQRVTACEFDVAVITNITHEHLDYQRSYERIPPGQGRLFTGLVETHTKAQGNPRAAVLNRDDASYDFLHGISPVYQIAYGLQAGRKVFGR